MCLPWQNINGNPELTIGGCNKINGGCEKRNGGCKILNGGRKRESGENKIEIWLKSHLMASILSWLFENIPDICSWMEKNNFSPPQEPLLSEGSDGGNVSGAEIPGGESGVRPRSSTWSGGQPLRKRLASIGRGGGSPRGPRKTTSKTCISNYTALDTEDSSSKGSGDETKSKWHESGLWWIVTQSYALKSKCHFDEIFVTGGSCQNDNFRCSQWRDFRLNDVISGFVQCDLEQSWMDVS